MSKKSDFRKVALFGCLFLVLLRMSIGWQFYYEGLWKLKTLSTATPWSAAGYLKTAKGPFRDFFRGMVPDPDDINQLNYDHVSGEWDQWKANFETHHPDLSEIQKKKLGEMVGDLKKELQGLLKNTEWTGTVREQFKGTIDEKVKGEIELYTNMLQRYEQKLKAAENDFVRDHAEKLWGEIQAKRKLLVGPVQALTAKLQTFGSKILTLDQLSRGAPKAASTATERIDRMTIWSLLILGGLLIAGFFSRTAAFGAACLLTMFYLAQPPWPGVPEAPGPEHSLIVNKNFIEIVACLALACLPTGRWVGLDALVRRLIFRKTTD